MTMELIVLLTAFVLLAVTLAVFLPRRRKRRADPVITLTPEDRHLLRLNKLTPAQWMALTDQDRAAVRSSAYRNG
ncbi:hypothetical protein [Arthrobacter sp. H5]|uniref:hypothetical protein n=1 Tax=Arthrobacter sp. H5 TaxID=1267973 RepID=UPI000483A389|nr:hypothetical protein [Arthrobacter sp. H5]